MHLYTDTDTHTHTQNQKGENAMPRKQVCIYTPEGESNSLTSNVQVTAGN